MSGGDAVVSLIGSGSAPAMLAARALLAEHAGLGGKRPVAVFADGSQLPAPEEFVDPGSTRSKREPMRAPAVGEQRVGDRPR